MAHHILHIYIYGALESVAQLLHFCNHFKLNLRFPWHRWDGGEKVKGSFTQYTLYFSSFYCVCEPCSGLGHVYCNTDARKSSDHTNAHVHLVSAVVHDLEQGWATYVDLRAVFFDPVPSEMFFPGVKLSECSPSLAPWCLQEAWFICYFKHILYFQN